MSTPTHTTEAGLPRPNPRPPLSGALLGLAALALLVLSLAFGVSLPGEGHTAPTPHAWQTAQGLLGVLMALGAAWLAMRATGQTATLALVATSLGAAWAWLGLPPSLGEASGAAGYWLGVLALAALAAASVQRCALWATPDAGGPTRRGPARLPAAWDAWLAAAVFGLWVLVFWQLLTTALEVPRVLLPAPGHIALAMREHGGLLWTDFVQTVLKAVLVGWALGCGLGFAVAIAIDRLPFLQRGLLPIASLTSTVPLVGVAPIAVMWFGFDWPSKAAVVVLMTFFPMLVSTLAGLKAADRLERELMHTYAATYGQTLRHLRLPAAFPFVVGAMKVNATLALIGAIVAEFFGSPTAGLGFRISTEAARMQMPLVWGAIAVAAVTGSLGYAALVRLERRVAFWHPSVRAR